MGTRWFLRETLGMLTDGLLVVLYPPPELG